MKELCSNAALRKLKNPLMLWLSKKNLSLKFSSELYLPMQKKYYSETEFKGNFQRVLESFSSNKVLDAQLSEDQDTVNDSYAQISSVIDTLTPAPELSSQETVLLAVLTITLQVMFGSLS